MKKNKLLKVLSAAALATSLAAVDFNVNNTSSNFAYAADETSKVVEVPAKLMRFDTPSVTSMGNGALGKVAVEKVSNGYKYSVYWKDLVFKGLKDGVSKFWLNGQELTLTPTTEISGSNPKIVTFTLPELKDQIEIEIFVQTMEDIQAGSGRQKAYLQLDTSKAKAEFDKPTTQPNNGNQGSTTQPGTNTGNQGNTTQPGTNTGNQGGRPTFTPPAPGAPKTTAVEVDGTLKNNSITLSNAEGTAKFKNDGDLSKDSGFNGALDKVTVKKVGNKYEYTLQVKKGENNTPRGKMSFELTKIFYNDFNTPLPFTVIDEATATKTVTFTTDKLYSTLPLRAATPYGPGVEGQHNVALVLNFGDNVKENPKDHLAENVTVDTKSTATGSFQQASDNNSASAYNPALVPEVKVEKVDNNYKYTFQVQPANFMGSSFELEAISYNGKDLTMKEIDAVKKIKEVTLTTSELFDKIQLAGTVTYPNGMGRMTHPMTLVLKDFKKVENNTKPEVPEKKEADYTLTSGKELKLARSTSSINAYSDNTDVVDLQDSLVTSISSSEIFRGHELTALAKKPGVATVHIKNSNGEEKLITIKVIEKDNSGNNNSGNNNSGNNNSGNNNSGNNNNNTGTPTTPQTGSYTVYSKVKSYLMKASETGKYSMGNAAVLHDRTLVYKEGNTYHYSVFFQDLKLPNFTDGITRFWVRGTEVPVLRTGGANNEVVVNFTSTEKLTTLPVSVFVQTMEDIMPGGGKQDALLTFDWSNAKEKIVNEKPATPTGAPAAPTINPNDPSSLTPTGGRYNNSTRFNNGRLANTGLETSSTVFAGIVTLLGAFFLGRRKEK